MTTFRDIFKSGFLSNVSAIQPLDMALALTLAFGLGLMIFFVYKRTYKGVLYSGSFGTALIALTMITTLAILAVTSNVVLSLGMVGALSIVRFRAAIKDPMDIVFLFWSIAAGIVLAAGLIPLAVLGSVLIGAVLLLFANRTPGGAPFILMITCDSRETEAKVREMLAASVKKTALKSKSVTGGQIELNFDIRLRDGDDAFVTGLCEMPGVTNAVLVSYNGDYAG